MITLATLKDATAQQVFDQVKEHMLKQNNRSVDINGHCAYRGLNGLKCAAGCLISDDEYTQYFEGNTWSDLVIIGMVNQSNSGLITALQNVHDHELVEDWNNELNRVAKDFNLKP